VSELRASVAPGTMSALAGVGTDSSDQGAEKVMLHGDLSQMGRMGDALRRAGFDVRNMDVYPVIQGEEIKAALTYLWERRIPGWDNQRRALVRYGVCTEEEFVQRR